MANVVSFVIQARNRAGAALSGAAGAFSRIKAAALSAKAATAGFVAILGAGFVGTLGTQAVRSALNAADAIQKFSIRTGASVEALSEYRFVAENAGVASQTLFTALQRMTRRIADAESGAGTAAPALEKLGIAIEDITGLKPEQQFELIADAMQSIESQAQRTSVAMALFDTEGVALLQTMTEGAAGIRRYREEARQLGLSLSRDQVDAAAAANDAILRLSSTFQGLGESLAVRFAPGITEVIDKIRNELVPELGNFENSIVKAFSKAVDAFKVFLDQFDFKEALDSVGEFANSAVESIGSVSDGIRNFVDAANTTWSLFRSGVTGAASAITGFAATVVTSLGKIYETLDLIGLVMVYPSIQFVNLAVKPLVCG